MERTWRSACGTQRIFLSRQRGDRWVLSPLTSDRPRRYLCPILSKVLVECLAVIICPLSGPASWGTAMDERVEALLADVLALEGEDPNMIREGVRSPITSNCSGHRK
jgi:hypothetical protein